MLDRTAVIGGSYENASGIFMRRAWCEMHHYCFHESYACVLIGGSCDFFLHYPQRAQRYTPHAIRQMDMPGGCTYNPG